MHSARMSLEMPLAGTKIVGVRNDGHRRHAGEMQAANSNRQNGRRDIFAIRRDRARRAAERERRQDHSEHDRHRDECDVPFHAAGHAERAHAGVMHGADAEADKSAAELGAERQAAPGCDRKSGKAGADRDEQRHDGENGIEGARQAGLKGQHGDEMRGPDRRAGGDRGHHQPAEARHAVARARAQEQPDRDPAARDAHDSRQKHEPQIVLDEDAIENAQHLISPHTSVKARHLMFDGRMEPATHRCETRLTDHEAISSVGA